MKEWIAMKLAWALPRRVAYWAAIRLGSEASNTTFAGRAYPGLTFFEVIQDWKK